MSYSHEFLFPFALPKTPCEEKTIKRPCRVYRLQQMLSLAGTCKNSEMTTTHVYSLQLSGFPH